MTKHRISLAIRGMEVLLRRKLHEGYLRVDDLGISKMTLI